MGLESATYIDGLVTTNPIGASDPKAQGDDHIRLIKETIKNTFPSMAGAAWRIQNKSGTYTVLASDNMSVIRATTGTWTLNYTAAATLGNKHFVLVWNDGSGTITIDPNASETINGAATLALRANQYALVFSDGTNLQAIVGYDNIQPLLDFLVLYGTASGTDTYTATLNLTAYTTGQRYYVVFTNANTLAAPTIDLDSLGAKTIKLQGGYALSRCDIRDGHKAVLLYDGVDMILLNPAMVGEVILGMMSATRGGFLLCGGQAVSRTTYASLYKYLNQTATVTITNANPGVVTWTAHGRNANDPVKFTSTGALPTGLVAGTTYYVVGSSITTDTFQISAARNGTAIDTTGTQSGTHTGIHTPYGDGDGSTTFNVPDLRGYAPVGMDNLGGTGANRVTGAWADGIAGTGGTETHTLTASEIAVHAHQMYGSNGAGGSSAAYTNGASYDSGAGAVTTILADSVASLGTPGYGNGGTPLNTGSNSGGNPHPNIQPSLAVAFMIRA